MDQPGLLVIGVGLPRTGTWSTAHALSQLLDCPIEKIHHGMQLTKQSHSDLDFWINVLSAKNPVSHEEWRHFFKGYTACLDLPAILFYKELLAVFPNSRVILTVRDPRSWYMSWHNSIAKTLELIESAPYKWFVESDKKVAAVHTLARKFKPSWCRMSIDEAFSSPDKATIFYQEWIEDIQRTVPADRLLIFDVRQSWPPICRFLDVKLTNPEQPFPRLNEAEDFMKMVVTNKWMIWLKLFSGSGFFMLFISVLTYCILI